MTSCEVITTETGDGLEATCRILTVAERRQLPDSVYDTFDMLVSDVRRNGQPVAGCDVREDEVHAILRARERLFLTGRPLPEA